MSGYRKLTKDELSSYGIKLNPSKDVRDYVNKYYEGGDRALVVFNSEYNDEGYDCSVQTIIVYDKFGNELTPKKEFSVEARKNIPYLSEFTYNDYGHNEPLEDIVVFVGDLPDLYIKVEDE